MKTRISPIATTNRAYLEALTLAPLRPFAGALGFWGWVEAAPFHRRHDDGDALTIIPSPTTSCRRESLKLSEEFAASVWRCPRAPGRGGEVPESAAAWTRME